MSIFGAIGAIATVASVAADFKAARAAEKQADAQRQAAALARKQAELENARKRREIARQRIIAAASNQARAQAAGLGGSSILSGIQGALSTNAVSALSFLNQQSELSTQQGSFLDQAAQFGAQANVLSAFSTISGRVGGIALNAFKNTPEFDKFAEAISG